MEKVSNYSPAKETGKKVSDFLYKGVQFFFAQPSLDRKRLEEMREESNREHKDGFDKISDKINRLTDDEIYWDIFSGSFVGGLYSAVFSAASLAPVIHSMNPDANFNTYILGALPGALLGITTNVLSGIYELYQNSKEEILKKQGSQVLENLAQ